MHNTIDPIISKISVMNEKLNEIYYFIRESKKEEDAPNFHKERYIIPKTLHEKKVIKLNEEDKTPTLIYIKDKINDTVITNIRYRNLFYRLSSLIKADKSFTNDYDLNEYINFLKEGTLISDLAGGQLSPDMCPYVLSEMQNFIDSSKSINFEGENTYHSEDIRDDIVYYETFLKYIIDNIYNMKDMILAIISVYDITGMSYREGESRNLDAFANSLFKTNIKNIFSNDGLLLYTIETYYKNMCTDMTDERVVTLSQNIKRFIELFFQNSEKTVEDVNKIIDSLNEYVTHISRQFTNSKEADSFFNE